MKAVLISIKTKWYELIASGEKTVEVRKTKPKLETPFKVYIYETLGKKKRDVIVVPEDQGGGVIDIMIHEGCGEVVGEFICDEIFPIRVFENGSIQDYMCHRMERSCVPYDDIANYIGKDRTGYGWLISDLVIYDKPLPLSDFKPPCDGFDKRCRVSCAKITIDGKSRCTRRQFTRPSQSWCYVEELTEGGAENNAEK